MHEPQQQLTLLNPGGKLQSKRSVEYVPPTTELVEKYIHKVCKQLTRKTDQNHCDTDFVRGLTTFMNVVVRIQTRYLNQGVNHVQQKD